VLDSLFYAQPNEKETTTVHQITLPPSTGERSEGVQVVRSKRKEFKDVKKKKREKCAYSTPPSLNNKSARFYEHHANRLNHSLLKH